MLSPELLVVIIQSMQPREVLNMSLLFPDLFTEGMWRSLTVKWDHYSYLPFSPRKRYAEIAYRTCLITGSYVRQRRKGTSCTLIASTSSYYSIRQQGLFAIHNKRKDILERLASQHPAEMHILYEESLQEDKLHCNRRMFNHLATLLDIKLTERQKFLAEPKLRADSRPEQVSDHLQVSVLYNPKGLYSRWLQGVSTEPGEDLTSRFIKDLCIHGDTPFWFMVYSRSQEVDVLERFVENSTPDNLETFHALTILKGLFCGNHMRLACIFGVKLNIDMDVGTILSCLALYYFNTGDDKGLYESLCYIKEKGVLKPGPYTSDIFRVELPEVISLLSENGIVESTESVRSMTFLLLSRW